MIMTIDIGGTKTSWIIWQNSKPVAQGLAATDTITDFSEFIKACTGSHPVKKTVLAMAGPVTGGKLQLTNTGQLLDLQQLKNDFSHTGDMLFLNDLEALAHSIPCLHEPEQIVRFRSAAHAKGAVSADAKGTASSCRNEPCSEASSSGAKVVVSLGTGLGISAVSREGTVIPSEGGHMDFAPATPKQQLIYEKLARKYGHVSCERLLSGQGLVNIYQCISEDSSGDSITSCSPAQLTAAAKTGNKAALEAFDIFTEILAAACGNYALIYMASGGIYLGGGMTPKILPLINRKIFDKAFAAKGRFTEFINQIPVYAITDESAPSIGAMMYAKQHIIRDCTSFQEF